MSKQTFHTYLYSEAAFKLMKRLPSSLRKHWDSGQMRSSTSRFNNLIQAPDGEVVFPPDEGSYYYWESRIWNGTNDKAMEWIAVHLKLLVKSHYDWDRSNSDVIGSLSDSELTVTVAEAYLVYDLLMRRKNLERKYSANMIRKWKGEQRDPISTELETARREEVKRIEREAYNAVSLADDARRQKRDEWVNTVQKEFYKKLDCEYDVEKARILSEMAAKIKQLNESMMPASLQGNSEQSELVA